MSWRTSSPMTRRLKLRWVPLVSGRGGVGAGEAGGGVLEVFATGRSDDDKNMQPLLYFGMFCCTTSGVGVEANIAQLSISYSTSVVAVQYQSSTSAVCQCSTSEVMCSTVMVPV